MLVSANIHYLNMQNKTTVEAPLLARSR